MKKINVSSCCRFTTLVVALCVLAAAPALAQIPLFPGAEGFGGTFNGAAPSGGWFNNATIYHVTTLDDSGPGSFRDALVQHVDNKIIVFDVAGTIHLESQLDIKNVENYYIAGQTAPGPVTIYGNMTQITHSNGATDNNNNIILRYLTFRANNPGADEPITIAGGGNPVGNLGKGRHIVVDHVTSTWGDDENLSVANHNTDITVQYSLIAEATGGTHAYGSLIRPRINSDVTFHHNLYANDKSRNPRMGSYNEQLLTLDFVDNVIYNWSDRAGYAGGGSDGAITEKVNVNWVGNYAIAGPATPTLGNASTTAVTKDINGSNPLEFKAYQALNLIDSNHDAVRDFGPSADTGWGMFKVSTGAALPEADKATIPFAAPAVTTTGAEATYNQVVNYVGNWWWERDNIDARIITNVQTNTQTPGGVPLSGPVTAERDAVVDGAIPANWIYHTAGWDTESNGPGNPLGDGMPTWWELEHGLNPNVIDAYGDFDSDGYLNIVEYLNDAGAFPCPTPIVYNGPTSGSGARYELISSWKTDDGGITTGSNWQPSKYDEAQINGASVTVVSDKVGQHAGTLKIGAKAGNTATLNISGGWLKIADDLIIGAHATATGTVNLSGGDLYVDTISKGAGDSFNFTGGTLHASTVAFDLVNNGGTLSPGSSVGVTYVMGDLDLASGALKIELESALLADFVLVDGTATLGGNLVVDFLDGYAPTSGSWLIMSADSFENDFASITAGFSVVQQGNDLFLQLGAPTLVGDYNGDGKVSAADYTVWRDHVGAASLDNRDPDNSGPVGIDDYNSWLDNYGNTSGEGSGASVASTAVPEPTSLLLTLILTFFVAAGRRRQ